MTANKQQKTHVMRPSTDEQPVVDRNAATQVGQVIQQFNNMTQRLPKPHLRSPSTRRNVPASPERIKVLIDALGNPEHPDHANAVDALVSIGPPAIPALCEVVDANHPWLTVYRGAEVMGYVGDGRATGSLIQALQHPNSNVRWSAVRALAHIGDLRAVFELRRLAHEDHGRTSWGESVAGTAQSAFDQMRARTLWGQGVELVKTAITSVFMILALIFAFSAITTLQSELERVGVASEVRPEVMPQGDLVPETEEESQSQSSALLPLASPTETPTPPAETATPTPEQASVALGTVLQGANVRPFPSTQNQPIGKLNQGDEVLFLARNGSGEWYLVRLGERHASSSSIDNPNGSGAGWIHEALLSEPDEEVPVEEPSESLEEPTPTDTTDTTDTDDE
jgi:hypothetical protein